MGLGVGVGVGIGVGVGMGVDDAVELGVGVGVGVGFGVGVGVGDAVGLGEGVDDGVLVGVGLGVGLGDRVGFGVVVGVGDEGGQGVGGGDGAGDGEGVRLGAGVGFGDRVGSVEGSGARGGRRKVVPHVVGVGARRSTRPASAAISSDESGRAHSFASSMAPTELSDATGPEPSSKCHQPARSGSAADRPEAGDTTASWVTTTAATKEQPSHRRVSRRAIRPRSMAANCLLPARRIPIRTPGSARAPAILRVRP